MKQKVFIIAVLLTGSHLLVSSNNNCAVPVQHKIVQKLPVSIKQAQARVSNPDNTVLGVSPSTMFLTEI